MADVVAEGGAAAVVMHNRESVDPALDILSDMRRFFDRSLELAEKAGIPRHYLILDPGIGFGKTKDQNLIALRRLDHFKDYGSAAARRRVAQKPVRADPRGRCR